MRVIDRDNFGFLRLAGSGCELYQLSRIELVETIAIGNVAGLKELKRTATFPSDDAATLSWGPRSRVPRRWSGSYLGEE